jgi:hypothetical protein
MCGSLVCTSVALSDAVAIPIAAASVAVVKSLDEYPFVTSVGSMLRILQMPLLRHLCIWAVRQRIGLS